MTNTALNSGDAAGDSYANIQNLTGSAYNDTLIGDSGANTLTGGGGNDTLEGMGGADILDGSGGSNTASYEHSSASVLASLADGKGYTGDAAGDIYINIQNLTGSAYDDTLIGNSGANIFNGGSGLDTVSYTKAAAGVTASLSSGLVVHAGEAVGDVFIGIENLTGSDNNDILVGNGGVNVLTGGGGSDILEGMGGGDMLVGGTAGNNTASYEHASSLVVASLFNSAFNVGDAAGDSYTNIQNLTGSAFGDRLVGDSNANVLNGGGGDDILDGGAGTAGDTFIGGGGFDTATYENSTSGVTASLDPTAATGSADGFGDYFYGIEKLYGSAYGDFLVGDSGDNTLDGQAGNDTLIGLGGTDTLVGGAGRDTIYANQGNDLALGGADNDTFYVSVLAANQPNRIDGGSREAVVGDGNVLVLQDLVNGGSYTMTSLAGVNSRLVNIDTLSIKGDNAATALTMSAQDVQYMVDASTASQLNIKADTGDTITIALAAGETYTATVIDPAHTDYTIYNASHVQIAQIHWNTA